MVFTKIIAHDPEVQSPRLATVRDHSRPAETVHGTEPGPTEAELERGILDAIKLGALDLARALNERLARRYPSASSSPPRLGR
jgi:hypothetical protein